MATRDIISEFKFFSVNNLDRQYAKTARDVTMADGLYEDVPIRKI